MPENHVSIREFEAFTNRNAQDVKNIRDDINRLIETQETTNNTLNTFINEQRQANIRGEYEAEECDNKIAQIAERQSTLEENSKRNKRKIEEFRPAIESFNDIKSKVSRIQWAFILAVTGAMGTGFYKSITHDSTVKEQKK